MQRLQKTLAQQLRRKNECYNNRVINQNSKNWLRRTFLHNWRKNKPNWKKKLSLELQNDDFSTVEKDALNQVKCGAHILDVNAGVVYNDNPDPNITEPPLIKKLINLVQSLTDVPICIDSSVPAALEAGLEVAKGTSSS